jgi:hypothetical protein
VYPNLGTRRLKGRLAFGNIATSYIKISIKKVENQAALRFFSWLTESIIAIDTIKALKKASVHGTLATLILIQTP